MKKNLLLLSAFVLTFFLNAQAPLTTANDLVPNFDAPFGYGANVGIANGWTDYAFADIAAGNPMLNVKGIGLNSLRQWLPESFLATWGNDVRKDVYEYYQGLQIDDLVVFIGGASVAHSNPIEYCPGKANLSFKNLYEPIWDGGLGGTPVNDSNYFALYCYHLATIYGEYVKVWEVLNEPDLDFSGNSNLSPGEPGNWWENNPDPCDTKFAAPITEYIRMLRIAYEVIKSVRPDNFIAVGGLGHPGFLDAILRNTDNPDNGSVNNNFPLKGGAYFDCMSFHSYPHFDGSLQYWDNNQGMLAYKRHSDAAVEGMIRKRNDFKNVLGNYGYDGGQYPEKVWINTETNVPRKSFFDKTLFGDEAQKNYMMKSAVVAQKEGIHQMHYYSLFEEVELANAVNDWQTMGFYQALNDPPHNAELTDAGLGMQTLLTFMKGYTYDAELTDQMDLPPQMDGGAFTRAGEKPLFVIWAKTWRDSSEAGEFIYEFPSGFEIKELLCYEWNFNHTGIIQVLLPDYVHTPSSPIFLIPEYLSSTQEEIEPELQIYPNPAGDYVTVQWEGGNYSDGEVRVFDGMGKQVSAVILPLVQKQMQINVQELPSGVYLLQYQSEHTLISQKLIKK